MAVKFICDRCKTEMKACYIVVTNLTSSTLTVYTSLKAPRAIRAELCDSCIIELKKWLKGES
jgi:hypothetical protein